MSALGYFNAAYNVEPINSPNDYLTQIWHYHRYLGIYYKRNIVKIGRDHSLKGLNPMRRFYWQA